MVAADRDGVPARDFARAESDRIHHQAHRRLGGENVLLLRDVLLQDVVLCGARDLLPVGAVLLRHCQIHRPDDGRGRVDGHRGSDLLERQPGQQGLHVFE